MSSDCERALSILHSYLDGALDDHRRAAIAGHLDDCGHCLETYSFEAELRVVVARKAVDRVPPGLRQRVADQLRDLDL